MYKYVSSSCIEWRVRDFKSEFKRLLVFDIGEFMIEESESGLFKDELL